MKDYEVIALSEELSDIKDHLAFLYFLVHQLPKHPRVLELGVYKGNSTKAFLLAVGERNGTMTSVDIEECNEIRESAKIYDGIWTFYQGNDLTLGFTTKYDLIFLDTNHQYEHTKKELEKFIPMVKKGGYFVLHDTNNVLYKKDINRAVDEYFKDKTGFVFFRFYHNNGLLVIKVE